MTSYWPEKLSIGSLREKRAALSARCFYLGCKDVELRVYESMDRGKKMSKVLCLDHAIRWRDWDDGRKENAKPDA